MAEQFTLPDLRRILRESAGEDEGVDMDADILDTSFQALGYDSIALLEVGSRIQREYAVSLEDTVVADAATPRALLDMVNVTLARS